MTRSWFVLLLLGCTPTHRLPPELAETGLERVPPVISSAAAVLFWLPSVDSLPPDSTDFAVQLMSEAADDLSDLLSDTDISVLVTTRTRIYVEAPRPRAPRRMVTLAGLDYPWGVVFIEPGYAEQIVTGPVAPSDLRELALDYFGLEDEQVNTPIAGYSGWMSFRPRANARGRNLARRIASPAMIGPDADLLQIPHCARNDPKLQVAFFLAFHTRNAGIPAPMIPNAMAVCFHGCCTIVFPTIAAALRMKMIGVSG